MMMGITFTGAGIFGTFSVVVDGSVGTGDDHQVDGEVVVVHVDGFDGELVDHHVLDGSEDDCHQAGVVVVDCVVDSVVALLVVEDP